MKAIRLFAGTCLFLLVLGLSRQASATISPDGSSITPAGGGSLINSAGTWAFSTTTGSGGNDILLNGTWVGGRGIELTIGNGGQMYDFSASSHWYQWNGSSFGSALSGTPFPISANGSTMDPGGSVDLVNSQGIWAFSATAGGGGYLIVLNGAQIGGGSGTELLVDNGGQLYALNSEGNWYFWSVGLTSFVKTSNPTAAFSPYCTSAVVVGLQWSAVSGASTYNITRNGTSLETGTQLLAYTDQAVKATSTYAYVLTALNSTGGTVSTQDLSVTTPAASTTGDPAYCPSSSIAGMTWNWSTGVNQQNSSDLYPVTWGADGNIYFFFGDGPGFWGTLPADLNEKTSFGIGELSLAAPAAGTAPDLTTSNLVNVYGGVNPEHTSTINGKINDITASGSNFYGLGGIYESGDSGGPYGEPNHVEMVYSTGNAYSWVDNGTKWQFCNASMGNSSFCAIAFVNFGKGGAGGIDDYIYILGATYENFVGNGGLCNCTYLARVLPADILTYGDYQVLTGFSATGTPTWTTGGWSQMVPIFEDNGPRPLGLGKVVYNPTLKRFIGVGQDDVNEAAFYDAPNPWGPWTTIAYYQSATNGTGGWGNLGTTSFNGGSDGAALGINFINAWTSSNGLTMWASFSSNGDANSSAYLTALQGLSMDSFSLVSVTLSQF